MCCDIQFRLQPELFQQLKTKRTAKTFFFQIPIKVFDGYYFSHCNELILIRYLLFRIIYVICCIHQPFPFFEFDHITSEQIGSDPTHRPCPAPMQHLQIPASQNLERLKLLYSLNRNNFNETVTEQNAHITVKTMQRNLNTVIRGIEFGICMYVCMYL